MRCRRYRGRDRFGTRVAHGDGYADELHRRQVVHVVAHERDLVERNAMARCELADRIGLVVAPVDALDPELARTRGDNPVLLGRDDHHRNAEFTHARDAPAVAPIAEDGFRAVLVDQHAVVGEDSVEVEAQEADAFHGGRRGRRCPERERGC